MLFINLLCLLYLMVLIDSHTISKSNDNNYKINENIFDTINEVDPPNTKTRRDKYHRYKLYYSKDNDVAINGGNKEIKHFTTLVRATDKILITTTPKITTEYGKHHKSSKRRVGSFWRKFRGKDKKKEFKHDIDIDRKKRIPNHKKEPDKKDNVAKTGLRNTTPRTKGKKKNRRKISISPQQSEAKVTKRDVIGQYLQSTKPYTTTPRNSPLPNETSPIEVLKSEIKDKDPIRDERGKSMEDDFFQLSEQLDNITLNLSNLKAKYGIVKTLNPTYESSSLYSGEHLKLIASSTPFTVTTIAGPHYQGTAVIEDMVNNLKLKSATAASGQKPSLMNLMSIATTVAAFDAYPILRRVGAPGSGNFIFKGVTVPQSQSFDLSTFLSINKTANQHVNKKRAIAVTESDEFSLNNSLLITNEPHNVATRSIKEDTMTIAQNVEDMLQRELKNIYNKVKHKVSSDFRKEVHETKSTIKEGYNKLSSKGTSKHPTTPFPAKTQCPCKSVVPQRKNKPATTSPRVKKKDNQEEKESIEDNAATLSRANRSYDDYMMLNVYEQEMLAKTQGDNTNKMLAFTQSPLLTKNKREAFRLSKRNPETLTDVQLREIVQKLNDDGGNMPEYDYIEPMVNVFNTSKSTPKHNYSSNYNDVDYIVEAPIMTANRSQDLDKPPIDANNQVSIIDNIYDDTANTAKDTSLEGLSNKISYKQFVDGYRHYLKFQKDQNRQNFSNLVKYQAHRHHSVDSIGKYILDKIPPVPSSYADKRQKRFSDEAENNMDYQEITTKSEDSWFKKHFYLFIDNGPPKKFHTSQTVKLKSPIDQKLYITDPTAKPGVPGQPLCVHIDSDAGARKAKMSPKVCLDDLSKILDNIKDKQSSVSEAELKAQTNPFMPYSMGDNSIHSRSFIGKLFSGKRRRDDKKQITTTNNFPITDYMFTESMPERLKRSITNDEFKNTLIDDFINKGLEEKVTTFSPNHLTKVLADAPQSNKDTNKYGYVDIDLVPRQTAVVKLRENAKKSRIKSFFKKFQFNRKKKKAKPKRDCYEDLSRNNRIARFNPIKKLKSILFSKDEKDKEDDASGAMKFRLPDYDLVNSGIETGTFKNMKSEKILSVDEIKKQIPNISDIYFENEAKVKSTHKQPSFSYKLDKNDQDLLYDYNGNKGKPSPAKEAKDKQTTKSLAKSSDSTSSTDAARKKLLQKIHTPSRNLITVNVKTIEQGKTTDTTLTTEPPTLDTLSTETTLSTIEEIALSLNNMLSTLKQGTVVDIPVKTVRYTPKPKTVDIPRKITSTPNYEKERITAKFKKQISIVPPVPKELSEGVFIKTKLTRFAKFPIRKRHYKASKILSEPGNDNLGFGDELMEYFRDFKNTLSPAERKKTSKAQSKSHSTKTPKPDAIDKTKYTDYFNDLVLWHNDILNLDAVPNPLWKDIMNTIEPQEESPTTPNMTRLLMELNELKDEIDDVPSASPPTLESNKDILNSKEQVFKRESKIGKGSEIRSVAMDDNTLVTSDDMIIKGEAKYFQYINPEPSFPQLESSDFIAKFDNLNILNDNVNGKDRPKYFARAFENQSEPAFFLDTTVMAYDDEVDSIDKNLNDNEMSMLLQKKSVPSSKPKYNDHSTIMKTNKAPIQRFTTPLPMAAHDFNKFLKENSMDVEYVTSPTMELPTIQNIIPKRPASTVKTTYTRSLRPTVKKTTTTSTTVSPTTTRRQNIFTKQLVKFTKALSVFKPSNLSHAKRAYWKEDTNRIKRYTDLSKTHNCEAAKSYTTTQEGNYYNILKKKMKERLFEKKETAAAQSSKATFSPDPHKPVEITIINFDDIEKMTHQPFGSFALPGARKDELITFLEYPETSTEATRKHVDATKVNKVPTNKEENVHNELLYKDVFHDFTTSTYSPPSYTSIDLPLTNEVPNPIFNEPPVVTYHKAKYPYERIPTYPTIFNKMPHAEVPKRVHISSHHYKYDIFYDDQGVRRRFKKPKYVADGFSQAALSRKTTVLPAKFTKGMPITHRRVPNSDKDKNTEAEQKIYKRNCDNTQNQKVRGTGLTNKHRMQISLRRYNPKPYGSLMGPRPDIELKIPSLNRDNPDLFRSWQQYPTTTSLYNETLVSEIWHKTPILSLLDNATENYEIWHQDPMSSQRDNPFKMSETWRKVPVSSKEEANLGFESRHDSLSPEHGPNELSRPWFQDPLSSIAVYTTVVAGIRDKDPYDNPTWQKAPIPSTADNLNLVSETSKHSFLSAVNNPTEKSETWPKDPISLSSENTLATQILHQDPMTSTVDKATEITDTWLKNFISSTVKSVYGAHKDTTLVEDKFPELSWTWRKDPIEENRNIPSKKHKDILAEENPRMSQSWPKDTLSLHVKDFPSKSKTKPKGFKSDAGGMVARLDKLELDGNSRSDLDLAKLRYFNRSPFFTMFTIRHMETGRQHKRAPTRRPLVNELRLLKRTIGIDKPIKQAKAPSIHSNDRNRRLFKISALLPKRLKNLMRNLSTTTKHGKANTTTTAQIETTTTAHNLTEKPLTEKVIEESTENVKLAEPTTKLAQKSNEVPNAPVEISTEEIMESSLPSLMDPEPKPPRPPDLNMKQKELEDEKGEGFSFSYHPSFDTSQSEESRPNEVSIASSKRPPSDSTSLEVVIKDQPRNQQQFFHHHASPPDKTFKCKGKLMHNTASDVIFIEPPAPWFSGRQYTPLKRPPTVATKTVTTKIVPTKSTTTTEDTEEEDYAEHNDVKREVRQLNTYTAKDVAALEVVVDLMKNTLSYEESNNLPRGNNIAAPFETKSLHNTNSSTNSIQVHIAIPFDFQKGQKRSDRDVLSMNPVRVRKVFSAKMSSPVDLEYQVHSFEGTIQATPSDTSSNSNLTEQFSTGLTPGMYLLIDKPKNKGYALRPVLGQISYSDLNTRQAGAGTTASMTRLKTTESRDETTSMKSLGKVTLSKDFIAAVNQKLIEMYENMSRSQDVMNKRSERSVWPHKQKKEASNNTDKYINGRCIDWEAVKKYFGHDRVCNCKCRCNKTMCNICAASDAVIDELIFEFDNIGKYMADHCTEIQTFFWMNPVAGQKLRDSVNKIDKSLTDYYKRVKGKCQGKQCKAYGCVDKRDFSKTTKVKKEDPVSHLINDLAMLAEDINKMMALKVGYNNKFKEKSDQFLGLMNRYIMKKSFDKRSYPPYSTTPKKVIKNVYSLDNINVNIICNPEVETKTDMPLTLSAAMPFLRDLKENSSKPYDEIVDYELQKIKRKGLKKLFPRKSKKSKFFYFDFGKSTKSNFKRQANQMEKPLISDGGGEFWYEYLKSGTDELRSPTDSVKDKSNIEIKVVENHGDGTTAVQNLNTKENNSSIVTNMMNLTLKTTSEMSKYRIETTTESLIYSIDRLLWLLGSLPDIDAINKNSNQSVMLLGNLTKSQKEEPEEFLIDNKVNINTSTFTEQDEPTIYKTGTNMYTTIAASIATAFKCPQKSLLDQKLAEISTIEQELDSATRVVSTTYKGILQEDISRAENPLYTVVITTKPAYNSPSKSMLVSSKLTTKLLTTESQTKPAQNTSKAEQNATKVTTKTSTKVSTKTVQLASKQTKTTKTIPTLKSTKKIVPTTKAITIVKNTTTTKKTTKSTEKSSTPKVTKETETTTPFFTVKATTLKSCFMDKLKTASMRFFNKVTESNARHKAEIEASTIQNSGSTLAASDLFDGKSIEMNSDIEFKVGQPKATSQDSTVVVLSNYDDHFSSENTEFNKEGYKSLLLSIIQFETNNLNDEWDLVAYGADKNKIDTDSKRNVMNLSKSKTTKPTSKLPPDSMYIGSEYDTSNKGKTTKKKPEGLLNKIASKMGLKIIPTKKKVANKQTARDLVGGKYRYNRKRSRLSTYRQASATGGPTTETCHPGRKPKTDKICDIQATYDHIQELQNTVPTKTFEKLVKNISCYKFKDVDFPYFTIPYKRKGKRWDWIRNKRNAKLHFYSHDLDNDGVKNFDETAVDSFERFAKGDDGIYKVVDRRKRTAKFEALDRGLRNIPPLVAGENELNVVVGDSVTLNCGQHSPVRNRDIKFLWRTDRPGMLEQDNVEVGGGSLTIHDVTARNAGTYTCLLDHAIRKTTKLSVLAVPSFDVVFLPVYKTGRNCTYDDLDAIQRLGGLMANEMRCGKVCSIRIDEPVCQRDRGTKSTLVRAIAVMSMKGGDFNCSFQCKRDIITSLVMLGAANTAVLSAIGVLVSKKEGVNQTLTPWRELVRPVVTRSLRRKDSNGHNEYHTLVTSLYPGKVDVVIICPSGYYLMPEYKMCASCPPNTSSKAGENSCRVCPRGYRSEPGAGTCHAKHQQRRYDWWWYPPGGYMVAGGGVVLGCTACVLLSVIVDLVSRDPDTLKCEDCNDERKSPKPVTSVTVAYARTARSRPLSPSRVILPRFFRPSLTSSRATDSQETKFELWKERNIAPPLPPIDFDP